MVLVEEVQELIEMIFKITFIKFNCILFYYCEVEGEVKYRRKSKDIVEEE